MASAQHAVNAPPSVTAALRGRFVGAPAPTWSRDSGGDYVARFQLVGVPRRVAFTPAAAWVETAAAIGAIDLPLPVRTAVLRDFKGYRFVDVWRVARAGSATPVYEVDLERRDERTEIRYRGDGTVVRRDSHVPPPDPVYAPTGTWRGESKCAPGYAGCQDEGVTYEVSQVGSDTLAFDIVMHRYQNGDEVGAGKVACTYDIPRRTLVCVVRPGVWELVVGRDSLVGILRLNGNTVARNVTLRRQP